jgi:ABC-2 type transport system permease protein
MGAFVTIAAKSFRRQLAYRAAFWTELVINFIFLVLYVCLWTALMGERAAVAGYDRREVLTYIVVAQTVMTTEFTLRTWREIETKVRTGAIVIDLMRPIDFQVASLATAAGTSLHTVLFNMVPKLVVFGAAGVLAAPSPAAAILFPVSLALSVMVRFGIEFLIGLSAFWLIEVRGLQMFVSWGIGPLFSGFFAPLDMYPAWLAAIGRALPFQAIVYAPAAVWSGGVAGGAALRAVSTQAAWALGLALAGHAMLAVARRRVVAQGG